MCACVCVLTFSRRLCRCFVAELPARSWADVHWQRTLPLLFLLMTESGTFSYIDYMAGNVWWRTVNPWYAIIPSKCTSTWTTYFRTEPNLNICISFATMSISLAYWPVTKLDHEHVTFLVCCDDHTDMWLLCQVTDQWKSNSNNYCGWQNSLKKKSNSFLGHIWFNSLLSLYFATYLIESVTVFSDSIILTFVHFN